MDAVSLITLLMAMRFSYIQLRYFSLSHTSPYIFSSKAFSSSMSSSSSAWAMASATLGLRRM